MLSGALLTVRLMVMRPPPKLPIFLTSSFCDLRAVWPAKAEFWIAEVAMGLFNLFQIYKRLSQCEEEAQCRDGLEDVEEGVLQQRNCGLGFRKSPCRQLVIGHLVNLDFHSDSLHLELRQMCCHVAGGSSRTCGSS